MSVNSVRISRRELTEIFNYRIKCSSLPMKWYKALVNYIIFFNCWIPIGNAMTLAMETQISVAFFSLFLIDIFDVIILLKAREEMKRFHLSALKYLAVYGCVQVVILLMNIFLFEVDIMYGIGKSVPYAIFLYMNFIYFKKRACLLSDDTNDTSLSEIKYYSQDGGLGLKDELGSATKQKPCNKFCKHCGTPVAAEYSKCQSCGKLINPFATVRKFISTPFKDKQRVFMFCTSIVFAISTIVFVGLYLNTSEELKTSISTIELLEGTNEKLASEKSTLSIALSREERKNADQKSRLGIMSDRVLELASECLWYEENIALVNHYTASGQKYHVLGCRYLGSTFYVFTNKAALSNGWEPCSVCHK